MMQYSVVYGSQGMGVGVGGKGEGVKVRVGGRGVEVGEAMKMLAVVVG